MAFNKNTKKIVTTALTAAMVASAVAPVAAATKKVTTAQAATNAVNAYLKITIKTKADYTKSVKVRTAAEAAVKKLTSKKDAKLKASLTAKIKTKQTSIYKAYKAIVAAEAAAKAEADRIAAAKVALEAAKKIVLTPEMTNEQVEKMFTDFITNYVNPIKTASVKADLTKQATDLKAEVLMKLEELKVVKVVSVTAINSKTLEVKFNKAVDNTKATFEVLKDSYKINTSKITFNADKTVAQVELTSKITKGEYTVNVSGLVEGKSLTGSVQTQDEKVTAIEISSDIAALTDDQNASLTYKVVNQYKEDITKLVSLSKSAAGASIDLDGQGKIALSKSGTDKFKEGDKVVITLIEANSAVSVTKTVTISAKSTSSEVTVGTLYNKDGKTLNEDTDLSVDKFYLPVTVKDQYGNVVKDVNRLNGVNGEVIVTNTNPSVVTFGSFTTVKINDVDTVVLPVNGVNANKGTVGEATVTVISKTTGKNAQGTAKVVEAVRSDAITLGAPSSIVVANEDILFPLSVMDKDGKEIKDVKVLESVVKGITLSGSSATLLVKDGLFYAKVAKNNVVENTPVTVVAMSSTKKVATQTVIPKAAATPKVITGLTGVNQSIRPNGTVTVTYDKVKVEDQYGRLMSKEALAAQLDTGGYSIVVKPTVNGKVVFNTASTEITTAAGVVLKATGTAKVTENVTFVLKKGTEIATSAVSTNFSVVPDTEFASYKVSDVGTVYLAQQAQGAQAILADYAQEIVVKAVTKDGAEVKLTAGTDFTVKSSKLVSVNDGEINADDADAITFAQGENTAKATFVVTINGTGEEFTKEVTFSKEASKVTAIDYVTNAKAADYIAGKAIDKVAAIEYSTAAAFNVDSVYAASDVVVTDQYGVQVAVAEAGADKGKVVFADGTKSSDATLTFTKTSGNVTFTSNGTTGAAVTELATDAVFNTRFNLGTVASPLLKVTVKSAFSQADADAAALATAKTNLTNAIATAQTKHDAVTEGAAVGNTIVGSKATLAAAIATATAVKDNASSTTAQLNAATSSLNAAVNTFDAAKVTAISVLVAPATLLMDAANAGAGKVTAAAITGYTPAQGETLNVTSATTTVLTVDAATGLAVTAVSAGSSVVTVQVIVNGQVVKTGTVTVTVAP